MNKNEASRVKNEVGHVTEYIKMAGEKVYTLLSFTGQRELHFARKGLIAPLKVLEITDKNGQVI